MLINFFKSSRPHALLLLPVYAVALRLPLVWNGNFAVMSNFDEAGAFGQIFTPISQITWLTISLGVLLNLFQAYFFNALIEQHALLKERNYLVAYVFLTLAAFVPELMTFTTVSVSLLLVLFALRFMYNMAKSESSKSLSFNASLLIGLSSLFYPPSILLWGMLFFAQVYFRTSGVRELIVAFLGVATPFVFWACADYAINGAWHEAVNLVLVDFVGGDAFHFIKQQHMALTLVLVVGLISLPNYLKSIQVNTVKTRNMLVLLLWMIVFTAFQWAVVKPLEASVAFLSLPLAVILSNHLIYIKRRWVSELIYVLLLASLVMVQIQV